jgi:LemA protein
MWVYNGLLSSDESIKSLQAQVDNMYERRADLVPQVSAVVKKYAEYEWWVLTGIAGLRSNATALENMAKQGDVKSEAFGTLLASTLGGMKIISENYPTLKADTQFTNLYTTLEGSENRIRTAIMDYNDAIVPYNTKVRTFPTNLVANFLDMGAKDRITPAEWKDIKAVPDVEWLLD